MVQYANHSYYFHMIIVLKADKSVKLLLGSESWLQFGFQRDKMKYQVQNGNRIRKNKHQIVENLNYFVF